MPKTHCTSTRLIIERARHLRQNRTEAEKALWQHLRRGNLEGFRFRQQHPIGQYIADFFCGEARLVIELDGDVHETGERREHDRMRDWALKDHGLVVLRFRNEAVVSNMANVVEAIRAFLLAHRSRERFPAPSA